MILTPRIYLLRGQGRVRLLLETAHPDALRSNHGQGDLSGQPAMSLNTLDPLIIRFIPANLPSRLSRSCWC